MPPPVPAVRESDPRKSEIPRARNVAMAYRMLKTDLRTIEVGCARLAHLQEQVPGKVWRWWVHCKGRSSADEYVHVLREVYDRIQAYLTFRPRPLKGSDPLLATQGVLWSRRECGDASRAAALDARDPSHHYGRIAVSRGEETGDCGA